MEKRRNIILICIIMSLFTTSIHASWSDFFKKNDLKSIESIVEKYGQKNFYKLISTEDNLKQTLLHYIFKDKDLNINDDAKKILSFLFKELSADKVYSLFSARDDKGKTPLHCLFSDEEFKIDSIDDANEILSLLFEKLGSNKVYSLLTIKDDNRQTLLHHLFEESFLKADDAIKILSLLFKKLGSDKVYSLFSARDGWGKTPFYHLFENTSWSANEAKEIVSLLFKELPIDKVYSLLSAKGGSGQTPLHHLFKKASWSANEAKEIVSLLFKELGSGTAYNLLSIENLSGKSPLHYLFDRQNWSDFEKIITLIFDEYFTKENSLNKAQKTFQLLNKLNDEIKRKKIVKDKTFKKGENLKKYICDIFARIVYTSEYLKEVKDSRSGKLEELYKPIYELINDENPSGSSLIKKYYSILLDKDRYYKAPSKQPLKVKSFKDKDFANPTPNIYTMSPENLKRKIYLDKRTEKRLRNEKILSKGKLSLPSSPILTFVLNNVNSK